MSNANTIDLSNFLLNRPDPQDIDHVTDNDITIALLCALAESETRCLLFHAVWEPAFLYLKLAKTDENRKGFYLRVSAIVEKLSDQGAVAVNSVDTQSVISLAKNYRSMLRNAIALYDECAPANPETPISVMHNLLHRKMEIISRRFLLSENALEEVPEPFRRRVNCLTPLLDMLDEEKDRVGMSIDEMKATFLKWFDDKIDFAYEQKEKFRLEERYYASYEWGAAADAFEDAKKEFLRLMEKVNREQL